MVFPTHLLIVTAAIGVGAQQLPLGPTAFTAPGTFPTSVFSKYYNNPTNTASQPQPVISDPVLHKTYPFELTNPKTLPKNNTVDPHPLPPKASENQLFQRALKAILGIADDPAPTFGNDTCGKCIAALQVGQMLALAAPEQVPGLLVTLCDHFKFSSTCGNTFSKLALGSVITQVLANANVGSYDGQLLCQNFLSLCPLPPTSALNLTGWFAKPKPSPAVSKRKPSGKRVKVLHISDFHLDPRYETGAEGNCTTGLCCRDNAPSPANVTSPQFPAPRFGTFKCDTPYSLALAALQSIPVLAGTEKTGFGWAVYTGDLVAHDPDNQLSRDFIEYTETVVYDLFKRILGSGPVYAALGNHDSYNQAQDAPHAIGPPLANEFSWNYDHVAALWSHESWIPQSAVLQAQTHYGGFSVQRQDGLRVISINTDLWYRANYFNYINLEGNGDNSGMLRFLTDELQDAEDKGDRVWIIGHVLSGWDGSNPLENPTNLFYQIVDRFSPHVIANIFWGHTHEDQFTIFYSNNGTTMNAQTAQSVAWIGPSITPLTNLNSGFRVYEVDTGSFDILDAHTWSSDVNSFPALDSQIKVGPTFKALYSTRDAYGTNITGWGPNDPLNATWWHQVTEQMEANPGLVETFTTFQGKGSARTKPCTGDCVTAKICYMRSGSGPLGKLCPQNNAFASVQGG